MAAQVGHLRRKDHAHVHLLFELAYVLYSSHCALSHPRKPLSRIFFPCIQGLLTTSHSNQHQPHLSPFDSAVCETSGCPLARRPRGKGDRLLRLASRPQPMTSSPSWVAGGQTRSRDDGIQPQNSALLHWRGGRMRAGRLCRVGVFLVDLRAHASLPFLGLLSRLGSDEPSSEFFFPAPDGPSTPDELARQTPRYCSRRSITRPGGRHPADLPTFSEMYAL